MKHGFCLPYICRVIWFLHGFLDSTSFHFIIKGHASPVIKEQIIGLAEVREVFDSPNLGKIAGCLVIEGTVVKSNSIRILRDNTVIYEGELESLRRFKDSVNEVKSGTECGIGVKNYNDVKIGDQIECFTDIEVKK